MSINTLGHSEALDRYWSEDRILFNDNIDIKLKKKKIIDDVLIDNYSYKSQVILSGKFNYKLSSRKGAKPLKPSGEFEYRTSSGIFSIETESKVLEHKKVISKINNQISNDAKISEKFGIPRDLLWSFLESAEYIDKMVIHGEGGKVEVNELMSVVSGSPKDPIRELKRLHDSGEIEYYSGLKSLIKSIDIPNEINSVFDLDIDLYQNRIHMARADYQYNGEFVTVVYSKGSFELNPDSKNMKEYGLQLIERDIVAQM
jgi:hypothetical protein